MIIIQKMLTSVRMARTIIMGIRSWLLVGKMDRTCGVSGI